MESVVVGVDLSAGRGTTAMATLHLSSVGSGGLAALTLLRLAHAADDDAILAEVARARPSHIGLDAPLTLPAPVAAALRGDYAPTTASPYTRAAERDPIWSQLGVRPFPVSFLGGLTFRAIPLAARLRAEHSACQLLEVFPSAAFTVLGLIAPTQRGQPRLRKAAPDRRQATHTALARYISGLTPPSESTLDADSLDAIAAALTAAVATLGAAQAIGEPSEGCIILPSQSAETLFTQAGADASQRDRG
jgi:predicted nuclease with RNAse H fold